MKTFYWLLKRELWEHRGLLIAPAMIGGLAVFFMLIGLVKMGDGLAGFGQFHQFSLADVAAGDHLSAVRTGIVAAAMPFSLVLLILVTVYLLDALYGERRDRSILFWKSLPVSDTAVVLSKLATATLVAPLVTLVVVAASQLAVLILASIGFLLMGADGWAWLWNPLGWLWGWASLAYGYLLLGVVLLPYLAWLLLASAWARRSPSVWATVLPLALMILERWFLGTGYLAQWMFGHLGALMSDTFQFLLQNHVGGHASMLHQPGLGFFVRPDVLGGVVVAAAFTGGAVWLRRYRDET